MGDYLMVSMLMPVSASRADRSTDVVGVGLVQKLTSRVPKDGQPGYTSCDEGMIGQSFW